MSRIAIAALAASILVPATPLFAQDPGPLAPIPYDIVEGWAKPFQRDGFAFGGNSGVVADSPDRILILQRGETRLPNPIPPGFAGFAGSIGHNTLRMEGRTWQNVIFAFNGDGEVIEIWDQWDHLFEGTVGPGPHRIRISPYDPERRVWVVHETGHQIFLFSNDGGELLLTLGEAGVAGWDGTHFNQPQDVAFLPDGRILVADGYVNQRVVVLDADGEYLGEFGEEGTELGQFKVVHSIAVAPDGKILIADRDNRRIQVFRENGPGPADFEAVEEWTDFGLTLDILVGEESVWVSDLFPPKITRLDLDGNRISSWHLPSEGPLRYLEMHSFAIDSEGNLYGTDNQHGRTQKFVPRAGADPADVVGPQYIRR